MKNEAILLKEKIALLENLQSQELQLFRVQAYHTFESLKPVGYIKNTLEEVAASPELKNHIWDNAIGLTTGFLSKKILVGVSHNPIQRIAGTLVQFVIGNAVARHSDTIKAIGEVMLRRIFEGMGVLKNLDEELKQSLQTQMSQIDLQAQVPYNQRID